MASSNMHNLTTLIKRLEAATLRLEDMASSVTEPGSSLSSSSPINGAAIAAPPSNNVGGTSPPAKQVLKPIDPAIVGFDEVINSDVKTFVNLSESIGGLVAEQAAALLRVFAAERKFLIITTKARKPDIQSPVYMEILKELQSTSGIVDSIRVTNRGSPYFNHLTTVAEGIAMIGWITVEPKPADFVTESLNSAQFYGNRILKEYRDKDQMHVDWVQTFYRIFRSLTDYIKLYYPSGVTWKKDGIDPAEALHQVQSGGNEAAATGAPGPPPPPPLPKFDNGPPPPPMPSNGSASQRGTSDMGAVFQQLSKGEAVTSGLRRVDPSQQTHKNPSLRTGSAVPPTRSESQSSASPIRGKSPLPRKQPKPESMRTKKPPRKELDGNKWIIENFDNPDGMVEIEASISHSILITRCSKTMIRIINKANAISIDSSSQISLIIDSLVSSVDVIKTPKFEMQVLGTLPTIMLDQVDGASIYLGRQSLGTEVFTSKCTAVNINVPGRSEDDDYREESVPEQVKTIIRNGRAVSEIVEHAG